ncbi:hypothetical protein EB118_13440 [bacterium]|nr:hypothetical protein [bacterium]NDG31056.1 hypothetical protein [bacterium]
MDINNVTKYNDAAGICQKAYMYIKDLILSGERDITKLCEMGDAYIRDKLTCVYKKETCKGLYLPVCISFSNCVGYNCTDPFTDTDIVKIELGVEIGECKCTLGETFNITNGDDMYIKLLDELQKIVIQNMTTEHNNFDVKIEVESKCTEHNCFPMENCTSYQYVPDNTLEIDVPKYIVLNHKKYYDDNDFLTVNPNLCFDFCEGEVYHINLTIVQDSTESSSHKFIQKPADILRFNDLYYSLKLKNSKQFCHKVKSVNRTNAFRLQDYVTTPNDRMGMKECIDSGILDSYIKYYTKDNCPVYIKKFTVYIHNGKAKLVKYK